tara:strand:- start:235 stop:507 length:273 start_codon:yes stop_codon:yes gene_type:complete
MKNNPKTMLVLNFINNFMNSEGYSPTRREIAAEILNGHTNASQHYITKLRDDELINVGSMGHRAIGVTHKGKRALSEWRKSNESDVSQAS